jgi:hypothetical protein
MTVLHFDCQYLLILFSIPLKLFGFDHCKVIVPNCTKKLCEKVPTVRVIKKMTKLSSPLISLAVLGVPHLKPVTRAPYKNASSLCQTTNFPPLFSVAPASSI